MVAKTYINDNGTWRTVRAIYVNDGTAWRTVKSQWVKQSPGTSDSDWKLVHRGVFVYTETISTNTSNYDLRSKLTTAGWDGTQDVEATITVSPGVVVYSTTTPTAAFNINPALPPASTVSLTNQGTIVGKAGTGGKGGSYNETPSSAVVGNAGGSGLYTSSPITINNTGGTIAGGGGGGGGGGYTYAIYTLGITYIVGGSGGGGGGGSISPGGSPTPGGAGGVGIIPPTTPAPTQPLYTTANGTVGSTGTNVAGGLTPGVTVTNPVVTATSGAGAAGGSRGNSGSTGGTGSIVPGPAPQWALRDTPAGAAGGASGAAISGNPLVTLPAPQTGTISGPRV